MALKKGRVETHVFLYELLNEIEAYRKAGQECDIKLSEIGPVIEDLKSEKRLPEYIKHDINKFDELSRY